jgi:hypothetical protein
LRFKFFPGSELSPPHLLGGIVDLDKPQHLVANVFMTEDSQVEVSPLNELPEPQLEELLDFADQIPYHEFSRIRVSDIMQFTSRRKAMC